MCFWAWYAFSGIAKGEHLKALGFLLWLLAIWLSVSWAYGVRRNTWTGFGVSMQTVNQSMLFALVTLVVAIWGFSPFHFVWLLPLAFIFGMLSLAFPFSLLSILGNVYGKLCCLGLDGDVVARNTERLAYISSLLEAGHARDEAVRLALEKFPGGKQ
mgnify:CR=1 FL=1